VLYDPLVTESDPRDWTYLFGEPGLDRRQFADYVGRLQRTPASLPMAILSTAGAGLGIAAYLRIDPAMGSAEVGSILYAAALQRTTGATEAMALMARHVFDDLGYRRYEWKCDSLNAPSRAAATRLGFRYEGRFRNAVVYKGRNRDTDWFAMTDGDWPGVKAAYAAWLDRKTSNLTGPSDAPWPNSWGTSSRGFRHEEHASAPPAGFGRPDLTAFASHPNRP
jgi:RimJ/RimL family protein N-acetyltransferase